MTRIYIGTSGFSYPHWEDGVFYPRGLAKTKEFEYYCGRFETVELNVTFYRLPSKAAFESWKRRSPKDFLFALKGSRFITHIKRLKEAKEPLRIFCENARPLIQKTACILWQLAPAHKLDMERLSKFVSLLKRRKGPRHAFEFRHESWFTEEVYGFIADAGMTVCRADWPEFSKRMPDIFPFEYVRRHGPRSGFVYAGCYSDDQLREDARRIRTWSKEGKQIFVYFNNDAMGHAVRNALQLKEFVTAGL